MNIPLKADQRARIDNPQTARTADVGALRQLGVGGEELTRL
jgi:hypothetical protein